MSDKFKTSWFWTSLGTVEGQKGYFIKEKANKITQRHIDLNEYAQKLEDAYRQLDSEGYDVINVVPISMGTTELSTRHTAGASSLVGDVGFSITSGAVIVGKKRDD